ncbi:hypothetical protein UFOVP1290_327 [uncultured Caudovirales phage]|uniref:Lipoprotein n=1 Tax=uncultured Caudovirales phage TaxID=2100421 RepID=A0A6J5RR90_9CAUD|nr:hypothetical protein UFOVP1290_327 [uncultured Caudovirales phage]
MKRIFFVLSLFVLSLASCTACNDTVNPPCNGTGCSTLSTSSITSSDIESDASNFQSLSGDSWEVFIPNEWVVKTPTSKIKGLEFLYFNNISQSVILLIKEKTLVSLEEYSLETLRGLRDAGAKLNVAKQVKLNDKEFILLDSSREEITAWTWVTVHNGYAYTFSCSGLSVTQTQEDTCKSIVNTLKIK